MDNIKTLQMALETALKCKVEIYSFGFLIEVMYEVDNLENAALVDEILDAHNMLICGYGDKSRIAKEMAR